MKSKNSVACVLILTITFLTIHANKKTSVTNTKIAPEYKEKASSSTFEMKLNELDKDFFLKNELLEKPENKYNVFTKTIEWLPAILTAGGHSLYAAHNFITTYIAWRQKANTPEHSGIILPSTVFVNNAGLASGGLLLGFITYKIINHFISKPINFKRNKYAAFENFVKNWDEYKTATPERFHELFDLLNKEYKQRENQKEFIKNFADNIIKNVRKKIYTEPKMFKSVEKLNSASLIPLTFFLLLFLYVKNYGASDDI